MTLPMRFGWLPYETLIQGRSQRDELASRKKKGINNPVYLSLQSEPNPLKLPSSFYQVMHSQSYQSGYYQRSLSQTSTTTTSSRGSQCSNEKKHTRKFSNPLSSKLFRARSKSPTPIEIPQTRNRQSLSSSLPRDIPLRAPDHSYFNQDHRSSSPIQMSPDASSLRSPKPDYSTKRASTPTRKNSDDYRRYSGTVNHCGRHSNDWLFGGFSVRETVRDGIEKLRHSDKES